jgi:hypothetical protein
MPHAGGFAVMSPGASAIAVEAVMEAREREPVSRAGR